MEMGRWLTGSLVFRLPRRGLSFLAWTSCGSRRTGSFAGGSLGGTTWEARHQLSSVIWLLHLPFVFFAMWLGAGLWWGSRRLFGNEGAFLFTWALLLLSGSGAVCGEAE